MLDGVVNHLGTSISEACQTTMRFIMTTAIILSFCQAGCGSSPSVNPDAVQTWPQSVADTCPQRKVLLECFRREGIRVGIRTLSPHFHRCIRPGMATVKVMLSIETKGGTPTCVARSPHANKAALCLASAAARHLVIPNSKPSERCSFRFPVLLQSSPDGGL